MEIYLEFLAHRRCLLVSLFLLHFPAVSGKRAVISKSVNNDNGMLIFTQTNTLHKTIRIMFISEKGSHHVLRVEFSFPSINKLWMGKVLNWIFFFSLSLLYCGDMLLYLQIKLTIYLFITFSQSHQNFNEWEWWVEIAIRGSLVFELTRYTHLGKQNMIWINWEAHVS